MVSSFSGDGNDSYADVLTSDAPSDAVADDAAVAAAPAAPPAVDPELLATLQKQVDELSPLKDRLADMDRQRQEAAQQAAQQQEEQRIQGTIQAINGLRQQLTNDFGLPPEQVDKIHSIAMRTVELEEYRREQEEYRREQEARAPYLGQAIQQNMAHQEAMTALGESATVAQVREFAAYLMQYNNPAALKAAVTQLAPLWNLRQQASQAQVRQAAVQSGATRVEGSSGMTAAGMNAQDTWAAYGRGEIGWSDRVRTAGRSLGAL